ncbi:MAG: response regulator [Emcibacter sp.]|nr:response regulator [Emcibacter sp.]
MSDEVKNNHDHTTNTTTIKILLVDDNFINHAILGSILGEQGHEVTTAKSGFAAIEALKEDFFDLIFMDIQMPDMDGKVATRKIRKIPGPKSEIPIIACTADSDADHKKEYQEIGMNSLVKKPIDKTELLAVLNDFSNGNLHFSDRSSKNNRPQPPEQFQKPITALDDLLKQIGG